MAGTPTWHDRISESSLLRWMVCMLRELGLVGCSHLDTIDKNICCTCFLGLAYDAKAEALFGKNKFLLVFALILCDELA